MPTLRTITALYKHLLVLTFMGTLALSSMIFRPVIGKSVAMLISPLAQAQSHFVVKKHGSEVFGFAPHWNLNKLNNVDFTTLTTLAYFGLPLLSDGSFDTTDTGYQKFFSPEADALFAKAHTFGTRVVLTVTQMDNQTIESFLDHPEAQERATSAIVDLVKSRGIDGVNLDIEYMGSTQEQYRQTFSAFVANLSQKLHKSNPSYQLTTSVYASAVKVPKLYDIGQLSQSNDAIVMMAYDFGTTSSRTAMPTAPLYGYKDGTYWYDVSTAVDDFLTQMPANKLILGVPYYGYNYVVTAAQPNAATLNRWWLGRAMAQTYSAFQELVSSGNVHIVASGWDEKAKVHWYSYRDTSNVLRMVYLEDEDSLQEKYAYIKNKHLAGVGIWALGFDQDHQELWQLLTQSFGTHELALDNS